MHVACVLPGDPTTTSGGFRYDRRLVASLRDAGETVTLHSVPWRRYPAGTVDAPRLSWSLPRRVADADVVVVDELAHPSVRPSTLDPPVVALVHHLRCAEGDRWAPLARRLEGRFLRAADAALCTSRPTADSVRQLAPLPTLVAPPVCDQFEPGVDAEAVVVRADREPFRVAFVGSVVPRKCVVELVDALAALDREFEGAWEATVVGAHVDADYADRVRRRCRRRGVADRVRLVGALSTSETAAVLERSHVLAMPSTHEGFGIVYLEAMGFGVVPVATRAGGASDLVTHGETGFLVPPGGAGAVAAVLTRLAADRTRLANLGRAALARYRRHPSWEVTGERVRRYLAAVAEGDTPARLDATLATPSEEHGTAGTLDVEHGVGGAERGTTR